MAKVRYNLRYNSILDNNEHKSTDDATLEFDCSGRREHVSKIMDAIHLAMASIDPCPEDCPGRGPEADTCIDCERNK